MLKKWSSQGRNSELLVELNGTFHPDLVKQNAGAFFFILSNHSTGSSAHVQRWEITLFFYEDK